MKNKIKPGSSFLFCLIQILNIVYAASACALVGLGIWLWTELDTFSYSEMAFIILGIFELILVVICMTAKKSTIKLRCFLFLMAILFLIELVSVIIVFALGDKMIDEVVDKADAAEQWDKLKGYLNLVNYFVIGSMTVELFLLMFVYCYIGSLRNKNFQYDYKLVDDQGNQYTVEQKQLRDREKIEDKYSKKREQLANKYPNYKAHNESK